MFRLFTSESVTCGHPDKLADQISDAILDDVIRQDSTARVAIETLVANGLALIAGELTTTGYSDIPAIVRGVIRDAGYDDASYGFDHRAIAVITSVNGQSPDIARGTAVKMKKKQGAGDQGMMFGYACRETPALMPLPITLAHALTKRLADVRKQKILPYLRPDGKSQVTVAYDAAGNPERVATVVLSTQHDEKISQATIKKDVIAKVIKPALGEYFSTTTELFINPTGRFVVGGPPADTGLTGRKIIVDTYGGYAHHGGGAFSGKDPSKVDRSAAYMGRLVAKTIVAAKLADRAEVQIAYAIGHHLPVSVAVETFGTEKIAPEKIVRAVTRTFDLSPAGIITTLDLLRPIYRETATYGHFGRTQFSWEKLNHVAELQRAAL